MNSSINLKGNSVYSWFSYNSIHCIGYFFDLQNNKYTQEQTIDYIVTLRKTLSLQEITQHIHGIYTIVEVSENETSIICDSINYYPVFYTFYNNIWHISDSWNSLLQLKNIYEPNSEAFCEFETAGFVLDNETLDTSIFKTKSSEILHLNHDGTITRNYYFSFFPSQFYNNSFEELHSIAKQTLDSVTTRLISFLNNRTALVPLSGGYDSRLIVSLLKSVNYTKVICFTYGKMNKEVPISKRVAETLGYPWYFIDYEKLDITNFIHTNEFIDYVDFAANGYAMPYLQEFFAVKELKNKKLIPNDSVFLPGHTGDYIAGSYLEKTIKTKASKIELPIHLETKYFIFKQKSNKEKQIIRKRISKTLQKYNAIETTGEYNPIIEDWDISEKFSKFIFRSSNVFNYFGYEQYFPLWDTDLVNFYRAVPFEYRLHKILYDSVAERYYFKPQHISFTKDELIVRKRDLIFQKCKDKIRYFFPWKFVLQRMIQNDWMYYSELTKEMYSEIEKNTKRPFKNFKNFNAVICKWYECYVEKSAIKK